MIKEFYDWLHKPTTSAFMAGVVLTSAASMAAWGDMWGGLIGCALAVGMYIFALSHMEAYEGLSEWVQLVHEAAKKHGSIRLAWNPDTDEFVLLRDDDESTDD